MVPTPTLQSAPDKGGANISAATNEYEEALDRLQPLQPVLRGFNHRNRNQHRRAAWWGPFGMLRRHVDKLADELVDSAASRSKSKKRKRGDDDEGGRAEKKVRDHVKWLRDVLVPKCYLAFSQLTADNQFAALGVVLLGSLAQVHAVCVRLAGDAAQEQGGTSSAPEQASSIGPMTFPKESSGAGSSSAEPLVRLSRDGAPETPGLQGGGVVSRDAVARAERLRAKDVRPKEESPAGKEHSRDDDDGATPVERQQKGGSRVSDGLSAKPPKKKKKPKKGGDEFDDLFKGLF
ncbi:hypothetical protein F5Y05DRAFT_407490 [Hypoxylon sp. FL0543]|nr:hypothetical protein F5Y05DRAFT_407490 [Hypoxylon sp. FL0543]